MSTSSMTRCLAPGIMQEMGTEPLKTATFFNLLKACGWRDNSGYECLLRSLFFFVSPYVFNCKYSLQRVVGLF